MGFFSRQKGERNEAQETPSDHQPDVTGGSADLALDTLASIVRTYGANGFDTEAMGAAELARRCDAWVRHVLTGAPPPLDKLEPDEPDESETILFVPPSERCWTDIQQFIRNHRRNEQSSVLESEKQLRDLITEIASSLRSAISDDAAKDDMIGREMSALSDTVQSNSLQAIRAQFGKTMQLVSTTIRQRQARYEAQLSSMSQRVRSLRSDLVEVRSKVDLDALTQLHNRGAFDRVLAQQIDVSFLSGQPLALLLIDLDHFKQINDTHGHPGGDLVLKAIADAIVRVFTRRSDFVARYGGEEFVVILVDVAPSDLKTLSERLLETVRSLRIDYQGTSISLTCSIGAAAYNPEESLEQFLQRTDEALYHAKHSGRDQVVVSPVLESSIV